MPQSISLQSSMVQTNVHPFAYLRFQLLGSERSKVPRPDSQFACCSRGVVVAAPEAHSIFRRLKTAAQPTKNWHLCCVSAQSRNCGMSAAMAISLHRSSMIFPCAPIVHIQHCRKGQVTERNCLLSSVAGSETSETTRRSQVQSQVLTPQHPKELTNLKKQ